MNRIKVILCVLTLVCITVASTLLSPANNQEVIPYGIDVNSYNKNVDYMNKMADCLEEGTKSSLTLGAMYEEQRNIKIDEENLDLEKTEVFTSLDKETVEKNYKKQVLKTKEPIYYYKGSYTLTFYCSCSKCCGKSDGITATGTKAKEGRTIAVDRSKIPLGSKVYIEGWGTYIAEDTGGSIKGNRIDVYVSDHNRALACGKQTATVWLVG